MFWFRVNLNLNRKQIPPNLGAYEFVINSVVSIPGYRITTRITKLKLHILKF